MLKNPVYVGKIRWREVQYDGHHDPVVSAILFENAQEVLKTRNEDSKGRQLHGADERLLTGIITCAKCGSRMYGASGTKNGVLHPYYVCSKRFNYHECDQHYVRGDHLETAIIADIKNIFRDEQFMARLWVEANKLLGAEKPDLEKEIAQVDGQMGKTKATIDRYFEAFEAGTLKAELCNEKVRDLRERLELPAIDQEMLGGIMDHFEKVIAEGENAKKTPWRSGTAYQTLAGSQTGTSGSLGGFRPLRLRHPGSGCVASPRSPVAAHPVPLFLPIRSADSSLRTPHESPERKRAASGNGGSPAEFWLPGRVSNLQQPG